jgi:hypothetical protein
MHGFSVRHPAVRASHVKRAAGDPDHSEWRCRRRLRARTDNHRRRGRDGKGATKTRKHEER